MSEEEAQPYSQPWAVPPGLSSDSLEYLHEDEHFRTNEPEVWKRHNAFINKSMSLSNLSPMDEIIIQDFLDINNVTWGFFKTAKEVTANDIIAENNGYVLSVAHISNGRGGFSKKAIVTQIRIMQQPQPKQGGFWNRLRGK